MKKIVTATLLLASLALGACKKEKKTPENETPKTTLNGVWVVVDADTLIGNSGTDDDYSNWFYDGDGYSGNVVTVSLNENSYLLNDSVSVNGEKFDIIDLNETGYGLAGDGEPQVYRYWIACKVKNPYVGGAYSFVLAKRIND